MKEDAVKLKELLVLPPQDLPIDIIKKSKSEQGYYC